MEEIEVTTRAGFRNGREYAKRGSKITVDLVRAGELHRNGLIDDYKGMTSAEKAAPAPANKQAPAPRNKRAPMPENKGGAA